MAATLGLLLPGAGLAEAAAAALAAAPPSPGLAPDDALLAALLARRLFKRLADAPVYGALVRALLARPDTLAPPGTRGPAAQEGGPAEELGQNPAFTLGSINPMPDPARYRGALVPATAAALAVAGQYGRAGALAVAHLGLHPALACFDGGLALLERYLSSNQAAAEHLLAHQTSTKEDRDVCPRPDLKEPSEANAAGHAVLDSLTGVGGLSVKSGPGFDLQAVPHTAAEVAAALPAACRDALARLRADMQG